MKSSNIIGLHFSLGSDIRDGMIAIDLPYVPCASIGGFAKVFLTSNQMSVSGKEPWPTSQLPGGGKGSMLALEVSCIMAEKSMDNFLSAF